MPLLPRLIAVPSHNLVDMARLPDPALHIFYDKRVADCDDGLKKYSGFLSSQLAFSALLMKGMYARSRGT